MISRRKFLKGLFVGAVAAVLPVSKIAGEAMEPSPVKVAVDQAKGESLTAFLQKSFRAPPVDRGGFFVPIQLLDELAEAGPIFTSGDHSAWSSFETDPRRMYVNMLGRVGRESTRALRRRLG